MKAFFRKPFNVFLVTACCVSLVFFTLPIRLFDGEVIFEGMPTPVKTKISLSYFVGLAPKEDLVGVVDFYLVGTGYLIAGLLMFGFPILIGYRVWLANDTRDREQQRPLDQ